MQQRWRGLSMTKMETNSKTDSKSLIARLFTRIRKYPERATVIVPHLEWRSLQGMFSGLLPDEATMLFGRYIKKGKEMDLNGYEREKEAFEKAKVAEMVGDARWGSLGCNEAKSCTEPGRDCLRDRVHSQLRRAEGEVSRAMALAELERLLEKHPDVARILDLMEYVKG